MFNKIIRVLKSLLPPNRPIVTDDLRAELQKIREQSGASFCIVGYRGFFNTNQNRRAIYDDAIFIVSPTTVRAYNANVDPGAFKKGIANLLAGKWLYRLGIHGLSKPKALQYEALVQASPVTVNRDEVGHDTGWFGINIHRGGRWSVSSLGCQTIPPAQWDEFIDNVKNRFHIYKQTTVPYILKEMK